MKELIIVKQAQVNNSFPNYIIDGQIKLLLSGLSSNNTVHGDNGKNMNIFHLNQMHGIYSEDEFAQNILFKTALLQLNTLRLNYLL